jgi:molybdopterin-guanine dinucleotide biosynthesis protein B
MEPYVVKFVSTARGRGKTYIASQIVLKLKLKGYIVGVVKHHAHGDIDVVNKDSFIYRDAGADIVILSSERGGAIFIPRWVDDLRRVLSFINTPIVIVEGFKGSDIGDTIVIAENLKEAEELSKRVKNVIGVVVKNSDVKKPEEGMQAMQQFTFNEIERLVNFIENRALEFIENQTLRTNCKYCGFENCKAFAKAFAMGKTSWCPVALDVKLIVDDKVITLSPFVKRILKSTIEGLISSLKGVNEYRKRIFIEIVT